jgi:phenylacetate-CoA ligase
MSIAPLIKSTVEKIPFPIGAVIARVPYVYRPGLGTLYRRRKTELSEYQQNTNHKKEAFIFARMKAIVAHAFEHIAFYRNYYQESGFHPSQLASFADLAKIPVVTKSLLQGAPLVERSFPVKGRYLVNTGGSSGSPLGFYIQPSSMGHEWAHMHHIWAKLGYRQNDLKLCFAGRDIKNVAVCYDALRHHYSINIYRPHREIARELKKVLNNRTIGYLHGYPSALYDFASYCEDEDSELTDLLRGQLKGAFLGSEYPTPIYRNKIESVFRIPSVSWYGHTERAILAWEKNEPFVYHPFQTYGYAEAVTESGANSTKLVGTSYYNLASPLIRYDTGDEIEIVKQTSGILESFRVASGREGDYVIDSSGKKISLTGLVFGRHHRIFDKAKFVQVSQSEPGEMTFYVTGVGTNMTLDGFAKNFDLTGIDMAFDFVAMDSPILSPSGKVCLKVAGAGRGWG